jgi:hypothetical protein
VLCTAVQCGEQESSCCLHFTEVTTGARPGWVGQGYGLPPTRGTAEVSRSRNLGQTVDTVKDMVIWLTKYYIISTIL